MDRSTAVLLSSGVGCGDRSNEAKCVAAGPARVCVEPGDGGAEVTTEGLEPGSELRVTTSEGTQTVEVGEDGSVEGTVGLIWAIRPASTTVEFEGTSSDGQPVEGSIVLD